MVFFVNRILAFIMYSGFLAQGLILYNNSEANRTVVLTLYAVLLAVMLVHFLCKILLKTKATIENGLLVAGLLIALVIQYFDTTAIQGLYIFFILGLAVLYSETKFDIPFAMAGYIAFWGVYYIKFLPGSLYDFYLSVNSIILPRTVTLVLFYVIRSLIFAGKKNERLALSLHQKNEESVALLKQVTDYSAELEKTADLRAKEKLMNELHNTLGHLLATASIGANAAAVLVDKDAKAAKYRLGIVTEQIHSAMQSLREVISGGECSIENGEITFSESMLKLISETEKRTDIPVRHSIQATMGKLFDTLPVSVRSLLYNALMEGLTNGIRHGNATAFDLELQCDKEQTIQFCLKDNGIGFNSITYGNGLLKMQRDAANSGAGFEINGESGCSITITVPRKAYIKAEDAGHE